MKIIHYINGTSFIITLLLYITIFYGMMAQVFLGVIQIILAIIVFTFWRRMNTLQKKHLIAYTILVILYGLTSTTDVVDTDFGILFLTLVPMSIAGYFVFITHQISKI